MNRTAIESPLVVRSENRSKSNEGSKPIWVPLLLFRLRKLEDCALRLIGKLNVTSGEYFVRQLAASTTVQLGGPKEFYSSRI